MKKRFAFICSCLFAVACSSPVEDYIKNDFARTVREDGLDEEIAAEAGRWADLLGEMAAQANPDAKEAKELAAKGKRMEQEIYTRMNNYKRTGDYSYIINIYNDGEECEAIQAKANRLAKKAKPYETHKDKQIKAFTDAMKSVDGVSLMNATAGEKNEMVEEEFIFAHLIGTPKKMATLSTDSLGTIATAVLAQYFSEHPTPTVKAFKYQKNNERWYVSLSDDTHYFLQATKCEDGTYDYVYTKTDDPFSGMSSDSGKKSSGVKAKSSYKNCDKFLDEYEKFANSYVKSYKKLSKKSQEGDLSVLIELQELATKAAQFEEDYAAFDGNMNEKQLERYTKITMKIASAMYGE